jgi:hypothetical protein
MLLSRNQAEINEGSPWFKRLYRETKKMSKYVRFKRVKLGFYRIYWKEAYIHEVYKYMPAKGYDYEDLDPRFESQKYYEEFEDKAELTMKIKNYMEGYYDSIRKIETRIWNMKNDEEAYKTAREAYKTMRIY